LAIDGAALTLSLNGGPRVSYTGTETDLQLFGPNGETVYVDVTSLAAGFVGNVDLSATGTLSIDGGLTEVPIDFSANQSLVQSLDGTVTFVDSTNIRRAGTSHVEYTGTADAFGVLTELRRDLLNARNLTETQWQESLSRRLQDIDRIKEHFLEIVGQQSATLSNLESVRQHHEDLQLETRRILSVLQATDLTEAITELQLRQNLLQTTYATTVTMFNTSLLQFLR
jgi:flagellin-like hook-associated protein FlgL